MTCWRITSSVSSLRPFSARLETRGTFESKDAGWSRTGAAAEALQAVRMGLIRRAVRAVAKGTSVPSDVPETCRLPITPAHGSCCTKHLRSALLDRCTVGTTAVCVVLKVLRTEGGGTRLGTPNCIEGPA